MEIFVAIYLKKKGVVVVMDSMLETIYNIFLDKLQDLEMGHVLKNSDLCELWDLIHAYELADSEFINIKERKQIIEYYG